MQNRVTHRRPLVGLALAFVVLVVVGVAIVNIRRPILQALGAVLIVNDSVETADVIVVTVEADGAGVLEAADLVHAGVATRVAVFGEIPDTKLEEEFVRRGIRYENVAERSVRFLRLLGIDDVELIPIYVAGSEDEGPALAEWCDQHRFRSVVVVSSSEHSRRLRRVFHRSEKGHHLRVAIRPARYSIYDPDRWWQSRRGMRTEIVELEKLVLDVVRHPIS